LIKIRGEIVGIGTEEKWRVASGEREFGVELGLLGLKRIGNVERRIWIKINFTQDIMVVFKADFYLII